MLPCVEVDKGIISDFGKFERTCPIPTKAISKHVTLNYHQPQGKREVKATTPTFSYNIFFKNLVQEILTACLEFCCFPGVSLHCENTVGRELNKQ